MGWPSAGVAREGRPESMESWGLWRVLKEAARLLCRHFRLFLPFIVAFQIPLALMIAFTQTFLLPAPSMPPHSGLLRLLLGTAVQYKSVSINQENHGPVTNSTSDQTVSLIASWAAVAVTNIFAMLATASFTLIVGYLYSDDATSELPPQYHTDPIVTRVFKLLPLAFLRMLATLFWLSVLLLVMDLACFGLSSIILVILNIIGHPSIDPIVFVALLEVPFLIGTLVVTVLTLFAQIIAVLEPENYGIAALRKSPKLVKAGVGTLLGLLVLTLLFASILFTAALHVGRAVAGGTMSVWVGFLVIVAVEISTLPVNVYFALGSIVMYFVCKSRLEGGGRSRLPEYQRRSSGADTSSSQPLLYATNEP